jgi:hypothetical protein
MLGVSAEYKAPDRRAILLKTSALSAICGTHLGDTNDAASMLVKPAAAKRLINSTFTKVGTCIASACKPSRGPTSTMVTRPGKVATFENIVCVNDIRL